jgi:hypothetical protein
MKQVFALEKGRALSPSLFFSARHLGLPPLHLRTKKQGRAKDLKIMSVLVGVTVWLLDSQ